MKTLKMKKKLPSEGAMSTALPELPPEIVIDIISRLPVKPLFRLKGVCKSWLSLISNNPQFAKLHLHYAKQDTSVNRYRLLLSTFPFKSIDHDAFCNGDNNVSLSREVWISRIPIRPHSFMFIGSCNGLVAFQVFLPLRYAIVSNPITGDFTVLPPLHPPKVGAHVFLGFGYDSHIDDYKLVRGSYVFNTCGTTLIKFDVFNLKANEWRSSQDVHTSNFSLCGYPASTNEVLHWLVDLPDTKLGIVSFDLGEEKFLEMVPVPDDITKKSTGLTIQGIGDNVWVHTDYDLNAELFEGWIMKRDPTEISWRKLYSLSRDILPKCEDWINVLWVAKNGNVVLDVDGYELLLYNPEDHSSLKYGLNARGFHAITYMETLVSPNAT